MKKIFVLTLFFFAPVFASSENDDVCMKLGSLLGETNMHLEQVESELENSDEICKTETDPGLCADEIKAKYLQAKRAFERVMAAYKEAGCADQLPPDEGY